MWAGGNVADQFVSGCWSLEGNILSINLLELEDHQVGSSAFQQCLAGSSMVLFCNNTMAVAYLGNQGHSLETPQPRGLVDSSLGREGDCFPSTVHSRLLQSCGRFSQSRE